MLFILPPTNSHLKSIRHTIPYHVKRDSVARIIFKKLQFHAQFVKVIVASFFIMIPLTEGNERREWSAKYMIE